MPKITKIHSRMIIDSRGNPTVEADVFLEGDLGIKKAVTNFFNSTTYRGEDYSPFRTYLCLYLWSSLKN